MRKLIVLVALCISCGIALCLEVPYVKGELLTQFDRNMSVAQVQSFLQNTSYIDDASCRMLSGKLNVWLVTMKDRDIDLRKVREALSKSKQIKIIQFNHLVSPREVFPNDPFFTDQWALCNIGDDNGVVDADIDATEAWDITTGGITANGDEIVIAIIDVGFELTHPDLVFWKNTAETPDNNLDDDQNGYVDDYDGWNAYTHNGHPGTNSHGTHVTGIVAATGNNNLGVSGVCWSSKILPICGASGTESVVIEAYNYVLEMRSLFDSTQGAQGAYIVATNASFGVDHGNPADFPLWSAIYDSLGALGILNCGATANLNTNVDVFYDMPTACDSDYLISVTVTTNQDVKHPSVGYGANSIDLGAPGFHIRSTDLNASYSYKSGTSLASPHVTGTIGLVYAALPGSTLSFYAADPAGLTRLVKTYILAGVDSIQTLQGISVTGGRLNAYKSVLLAANSHVALPYVSNLSGGLENGCAVLNWDPPGPYPGMTLLGYDIYRNYAKLNTDIIQETTYIDVTMLPGILYDYYVIAVYIQGESIPSNTIRMITVQNDDVVINPNTQMLSQNYPNPFNPETTISFNMPKPGNANLSIYNTKGQFVKTLANEHMASGNHILIWDGTDGSGTIVPSGLYFYKISAEGKIETRKMLLIK